MKADHKNRELSRDTDKSFRLRSDNPPTAPSLFTLPPARREHVRCSVLVVDDSPADRALCRAMLEESQLPTFDVIEVGSAQAGLNALEKYAVDCVLLDAGLPEFSGREFLELLRLRYPQLAVVAVTGSVDPDTPVQMFRAGADDYQAKNRLDPASLVRVLCNAMDRKELSAALEKEREQLSLFRQLVDHSGDLLMVFQLPNGSLVDANGAAREFLGLSNEMLQSNELLTRSIFPDLRARIEDDPGLRGLRLQTKARHADGHELALELDLRRVRAGAGIYLVASGRDMSERQQAEDQLRAMLHLDGLTGVQNRRAFDERFEHEYARAARAEWGLGVLMIDIDYFKSYNDTLGHLAGDQCLRQVARILASTLRRPTDFLARYGGEEFVVLLPNYSLDMAIGVALRLQEMLSRAALPHPSSPVSDQVTISIGLAVEKANINKPKEALVEEADRSLYAAKKAGRNRIDCGT